MNLRQGRQAGSGWGGGLAETGGEHAGLPRSLSGLGFSEWQAPLRVVSMGGYVGLSLE